MERVARHKSRYFGNTWTIYENAKPGPLRLSPPENRLGEALDYEKMKGMFTENPPPLETILTAIAEAEERLNRL